MTKYCLHHPLFSLLFVSFFLTSCNGQVEKDLPKDTVSESNTTPVSHPKLIKNIIDPQFGEFRCSLQDKEGNLWFGTTVNGLYKYDGKSFNQFTVKDGLDCNTISCLLQDKEGKIWVGTDAGLCLYNGKTFDKIQIPLPKNLPPNKNPYNQTHWVLSMIQAKSGKLWFVTIDGVYIYDGKSFTHFPIDEAPNGFTNSNDKVERILEDKTGNIWFGGRTNEGVYRYDGKSIINFKLKELFRDGGGPEGPKGHNWGWPQVQDKNGNIWFSNWGGAYRYDGTSFTSFAATDGLFDGGVSVIIEDKKGNIWFGGAGISRYDGKSFTRFRAEDGQANIGSWSILEDTSGNLWVGTKEKGLYIFDGKEFINYSEYKQ
jgi:ligand-binding sensor domain-containing protein